MLRGSLFDRPFGSLFRDFEQEVAEMERQIDHLLRGAMTRTNGGATRNPFVWGYTLQVGPDGVARFQPFGNVGLTQEQLAEGWREPFSTTMVDAENDLVRITAELPGVTKDQIEVETLPDRVIIVAQGDPWKYRKEVPVSVRLDPDRCEASYNNGILELTIHLAEPLRPRGKKVRVH